MGPIPMIKLSDTRLIKLSDKTRQIGEFWTGPKSLNIEGVAGDDGQFTVEKFSWHGNLKHKTIEVKNIEAVQQLNISNAAILVCGRKNDIRQHSSMNGINMVRYALNLNFGPRIHDPPNVIGWRTYKYFVTIHMKGGLILPGREHYFGFQTIEDAK